MSDKKGLAEALRQAVASDPAATENLRQAIGQVAEAIGEIHVQFQKRSEAVEKDLKRGAHLTRHRITL